MKLGYEEIKALAEDLGRPVGTMIALAANNDPFYAGTPARRAQAEWFSGLWAQFGLRSGVHLRRIHYVLVSQASPVRMVTGKPYENTLECWKGLGNASGDARDLDLVPARAFVDRRNDDPIVYLRGSGFDPEVDVWPKSPLADVSFDMPYLPALHLQADGIKISQRFHLEIWAEKTTVNDILLPLAQQYGLNIITGAGELSKTACVAAVDRARLSGRPMRILYVSDFDPAGMSMPVAVARKIEHRLHQEGLDHLDIQVRPVVLTAEQVAEYNLPRVPIKESERRGARFQERHGVGAVELDALEALHPGLLRRILVQEIRRYFDPDLDQRVREMVAEIRNTLGEITESAYETHQDAIADLGTRWAEIVTQAKAWERSAEAVWQAITDSLERSAPDPDEIEWPEPSDGDEDPDPLFDSRRSYVEQIDRYKRHQGKLVARKPRSDIGTSRSKRRVA